MSQQSAEPTDPANPADHSDLFDRLRALDPTRERRGDHILNPDWWPNDEVKLTPASVLIALVPSGNRLTVILTQRAAKLRAHAGQVALPGGKRESNDANAIDCALREAEEEIGLPRGAVTVLGQAADYVSRTNYLISPVVGLVTKPVALSAQESEVAKIFDVDFYQALRAENHVVETRLFEGRDRHYYRLPLSTPEIWGVTAGIFVELSRQLGLRD